MSKNSSIPSTLCRRITALLATLALLAAMALPVYAEAQNEDTIDTAQTEMADTISDGTAATENDSTTPEGEEETEDSTVNADEDDASENTEIDVDEDDEPSDTKDTDASDETNDTTSDDSSANPESPEDDQQDVEEAEDTSLAASPATQAGVETFTIYFAVPSSWGDENYQVYVKAQKGREGDGANLYAYHEMKKVETSKYQGRDVYEVDLTSTNDDKSTDCPWNGYNMLQFCKIANGNTIWVKAFEGRWTDKSVFADNLFDGENNGWVQNYQPFDPNNHQSFAGKTMLFQNQSGSDLANVKAVFYEKIDGELQVVDTIDLGTVAADKRASFKIPSKDCSYICFKVGEEETPLYSFYGQQDGDVEGSYFLYDSGTAYCYVYRATNDGSWTTPQGTITIYFDATFSSAYKEGNDNLSIPKEGSKDVYYCFKNDKGQTPSDKMTPGENNLYSVVVPEGYSKVMFSGDARTSPANSGTSTDWVSIDWSLDEPCYIADTNDAVVYNSGASRGGYWTEKDAVRDAEAGKGTTVVDIDNTTSFERNSETKYVNSTLYDYYTDWELNGNNRDNYDNAFSVSHRSWVPFRQFNLALSDYYKTSGSSSKDTNAATYPIYTGHFQPGEYGSDAHPFVYLHDELRMDLFGFDEGRKFMVDNNSSLCMDGNATTYGAYTVQGIVADNATNTSKDGLPIMRGTENSGKPLVEPHFNTDFLLGSNSKHTKLGEVYKNVAFPFTQNDVFSEGIQYWSFDAADTTLYLKQDANDDSYFLQSSSNKAASINRESNSNQKNATGFFPFNETVGDGATANNYNYGFGARLQFDFTLTDDGNVVGKNNTKYPIKFFFSGDDDVWVFIDGKLALDVGGAHEKASGLLVFSADPSSESVTGYVSKVKKGGTSSENVANSQYSVNYKSSASANATQIDFAYKGKPIPLEKGKTHTLTMYYMERGMWESNMAIAFNFPDHNELQVEKRVDLRNVDSDFASCFTDKKLFNFTILNQATHYGSTPVDPSAIQPVNPIVLSKTGYTLGRMNNQENNVNNYCKEDDDPKNTGQKVIHWYAKYNDTSGAYRNARRGVIKLNETVNIQDMNYLSFYLYTKGNQNEGTLSLSNLYLELIDKQGNQFGCLGTTSLSGTTYNRVNFKNNEWINIKLDLSKLAMQSGFDKTKLAAIRIGDNYERDIYFKDFEFTANPTITKLTGFTTAQKDIPDYGSASSGKLEPAKKAQFSSSINGKTYVVDDNGQFMLQDKEIVTFRDQFRRGSYLSVTEDADPDLFETTWTIYENGKQVKSMNTGNTVVNASPVPDVVGQSGYTPNDGRTENLGTREEQDGNEYKGTKEPADAKTIVFRSYSTPDAGENGSLAKLKLQFINKVKTGSLTIKKAAAADEETQIQNGTYTFRVTFTDVGGLGLESKPIEKTVTIHGIGEATISGIPVGTRFHIEEITASNKANVSKVEVSGGGEDRKVVNGKEAIGSIVGNDTTAIAVATFTNTLRTLIEIDLTKKWVDAAGNELTDDNLPTIVYVQLQRKTADVTEWTPVLYPGGTEQKYVEVKRDQGGWTYKFANLDANDYTSTGTTKPVYQYRVVEGILVNNEFVAKNPETDAFLLSDRYVYTYKDNEMQSTTTGGKTSNTITLTNKRLNPKFALDITKADAEDTTNKLAGVEFKLEKLTADGKDVDSSFTAQIGVTDTNGKLMLKVDGTVTDKSAFTDLEAGKYRLTETKAAKDYNLLSAPIEVEFTKIGQCLLNGVKVEVWTAESPTNFIKNGDGSYTLKLTVLNRKTPTLPHTGADAPSLWLLIGLPLAVAGLLILVFRYNKKGGHTR